MLTRIAIFLPRYYPIFGGAENQARLLNRELLSIDQISLPFLLTRYMIKGLPNQEIVDSVHVQRLGFKGLGIFGELIFYFHAFAFLFINRKKFDLIHCHACSAPGFFVALSGKLLKKPVIIKLSTNGELKAQPKNWLKRWVKNKMTKFMARHGNFIALNKEGLEELEFCNIDKKFLIPNGIDYHKLQTQKATRTRADFDLPENAFVIAFSGRFVQRKGIDILLKAFKEFLKVNPVAVVKLFLIGSTANQDHITQIDETEATQKHMVFYEAKAEEVAGCLQFADVFVFPSRREGMPNSVVEAIAMGLPCILSDIRPNQEIANKCQNAEGISLYSVEDYMALTECLQEHYEKFLQGVNQQKAILPEEFSIKAVAKKYARLYQKLLQTYH